MSVTVSTSPYRFSRFDWFCLWYPPGWLILFNRHWQHYKPDPDGWRWFEYGLFLLPGGFYLALLIRWLRLGCRAPASNQVEPDPAYQKAFQQEVLAPILKHYFRGALYQTENLPLTGPLIVAMNHAGMCFPWDFVGLGLLLSQVQDRFVQPLAHPIFFDHPWLVWWLPRGWAQVLGGVRAERQSFEAALASTWGDRTSQSTPDPLAADITLLYAPEGWRGLAKGWQQRYQLASFDPSFVRLSLRYQVPIVPVICMGSEYFHPWTVNVRWLAQWLKLPMFPLSPLIPAFLLFPSLGVWAVRTRLQYFIQPVWRPWEEDTVGATGERDTETARCHERESPGKGRRSERARSHEMAEGLRSRLQAEIDQIRKRLHDLTRT